MITKFINIIKAAFAIRCINSFIHNDSGEIISERGLKILNKREYKELSKETNQAIIDNLLESEYPSTIKIFKETDDDWFGNWPGNLIEVSCSLNSPTLTERKFQRVGCWGNDNYGLIKDFDNKEDALNTFRQIITWSKVNQKDLFRIGFKQF